MVLRALMYKPLNVADWNLSYSQILNTLIFDLLNTSNFCEQVFSVSGKALNDRLMSVLPSNFESQLFLHINQCHWIISDVHGLSKK